MTEISKDELKAMAEWRLSRSAQLRERRDELTDDAFREWYWEWTKDPSPDALKAEDGESFMRAVQLARTVGDRIIAIRKHYKMTQSEFADLLQVKQASVSRWEKNLSEPAAENLIAIADLIDADPSMVRYGPVEPTTAGGFIEETPVNIVGFIDEVGGIRPLKRGDRIRIVARPRECRPHTDVVGLMMEDTAGFGVFQHSSWIFFYRTSIRFNPAHKERQLAVIKLRDRDDTYVAVIAAWHGPHGHYSLLMPQGGLTDPLDIEWMSPIISIRQSVYPVDQDDELLTADEQALPHAFDHIAPKKLPSPKYT